MFVGSTNKESTNNEETGFQDAFEDLRRDRQTMGPTKSLISAIRSFDVDAVEKLLKSDFEIQYKHERLYSVLHTTVEVIVTTEESKKHLLNWLDALRRIVEVLLESGRFNVDALTDSSETALHYAGLFCRCKDISCNDYKDMVNAIVELLLKNEANINAKTSRGETPLMLASRNGCSHTVKLFLDWRDKHGAGVDLNARDIYGETALIKAAKNTHVDVVELLLQHGCLDKIQDHRGFYALHAVIYGSPFILSDASIDFLALIGVLASEETSVVFDRMIPPHGRVGRNDSIQVIVSLLLTRGCTDINSLDFKGQSVLDVALKSKLHINQKTVEKLKEYGATSCALPNKHSEYPKRTLHFTDKLGRTPLHRLSVVVPELNWHKKIEISYFTHLLNTSPHKEAFEEMTVAKDHRARTVLHYAVMSTDIDDALKSEDIVLLINDLKLAHIINERDTYGRTPLHYCPDEAIYKSLVEQGADEHIQDIDGKTPQDLKEQRNEEHNRLGLPDRLEDEVNQDNIDACILWKDFEYAYRDEFSNKICDKVRQFMNRLSDEIGKKDPRFECRPVLIGSAEEGTKTGLPDEFDFNFILTKLSELCEVVPSPEAPSGFVHIKRRYENAEYCQASQDFESQEDFDRLFNSYGFLLTTEIACRFRILYSQVLSEPEFWEGENVFEWDPHNEVGRIYDKEHRHFLPSIISYDFDPVDHPCSNIRLKLNRPIEGRYMFTEISLDIAPCVKVNGWWPEEALSSLSHAIKLEGCHLTFVYPWVPFSDPFARISFAPAESRIIKECSAVARAAFMVGKQLLYHYNKSELTYVLKTCLLYCIEALKDCTRNILLYEDITPPKLRFFVEKLMLCFQEFYRQDFLPCYMMPSFHLPNGNELKYYNDDFLNDSSFPYPTFAAFADELYRKVCTTKSPGVSRPPTPEPLNEKFDREELMRKLSMDRSNIEHTEVIYRRVQPEFLATEQTVCSDSQSDSQVMLCTNREGRLQMNANENKVKRQD